MKEYKSGFLQSGSGTYLVLARTWQQSGLRWVVSAVDALRSEAGVTLASASVSQRSSRHRDTGDGRQVPPAPGEVTSRSRLPSGERCGGHPEPCGGLSSGVDIQRCWGPKPPGGQTGGQSALSQPLRSPGALPEGLPFTRAGLSRILSQVECWAHCLAPALGRLHL